MRASLIPFTTIAALASLGRIAHAGDWYYEWWCTGECAPGQLSISGIEGPFATREDCEMVRDQDPRADYFVSEGNFGGLDWCEESADPPASTTYAATPEAAGPRQPPPPFAGATVGVVAGPSYRVEDAMGVVRSGGATVGVDVGVRFGARPEVGTRMTFGLQYSRVSAPPYELDPKPMTFLPLMLGVISTPALSRGRTELRLDLGVDAGALVRVGCSDCAAADVSAVSFVASAHVGLDVYFGDGGLGLAAVFRYGRHDAPGGVTILPPAVLIEASLLGRNREGVAW